MKRSTLPTVATLLVASTPVLAEIEGVETPSGYAQVVGTTQTGGEKLLVGDTVVIANEVYPYVWIEAQVGSLLLVGMGTGGTACAAEWVWVHTTAGDVRTSEQFGTCSDLAEVTWDQETVSVSMPSSDAERPMVTFIYDGGTVLEVAQGQAPSGIPPESGAAAWIGQHPSDLFRSSDWREPLVSLLSEGVYSEAQDIFVIASPMGTFGDWVAGSGCQAHMCDEVYGAVAINLNDGRLLVAIRNQDGPARLWGEPQGALPDPIAEVMTKPPGS